MFGVRHMGMCVLCLHVPVCDVDACVECADTVPCACL